MNNRKNKRKSLFKRIFDFCETIVTILVIFICLIILIQRASNNEKSLLGYRLFKIESGSMIPKYDINDVILVKERNINQIKIGDDLVYIGVYGDARGKVITHQVIDIKNVDGEKEFYTKGLANDTPDPVVKEKQILGVVELKSYILTLITNLLLNIYSLYFLIIVPVLLTLFFNALHSSDKKERYIQKRIEEDSKEIEKQNKIEEKNKIKTQKKTELTVRKNMSIQQISGKKSNRTKKEKNNKNA